MSMQTNAYWVCDRSEEMNIHTTDFNFIGPQKPHWFLIMPDASLCMFVEN